MSGVNSKLYGNINAVPRANIYFYALLAKNRHISFVSWPWHTFSPKHAIPPAVTCDNKKAKIQSGKTFTYLQLPLGEDCALTINIENQGYLMGSPTVYNTKYTATLSHNQDDGYTLSEGTICGGIFMDKC